MAHPGINRDKITRALKHEHILILCGISIVGIMLIPSSPQNYYKTFDILAWVSFFLQLTHICEHFPIFIPGIYITWKLLCIISELENTNQQSNSQKRLFHFYILLEWIICLYIVPPCKVWVLLFFCLFVHLFFSNQNILVKNILISGLNNWYTNYHIQTWILDLSAAKSIPIHVCIYKERYQEAQFA